MTLVLETSVDELSVMAFSSNTVPRGFIFQMYKGGDDGAVGMTLDEAQEFTEATNLFIKQERSK